MNEIAKQAISEKLRKACEQENVSREKASMLLGLKSKHYAGFITSSSVKQWKNVSAKAWDQARDWTNSGETLVNYHQKFVFDINAKQPDQPEEHKGKKRDTSWLSKKKQMDQKLAGVNKIDPSGLSTQDGSIDSFKLITNQGSKLKLELEINLVLKLNGQEIRL